MTAPTRASYMGLCDRMIDQQLTFVDEVLRRAGASQAQHETILQAWSVWLQAWRAAALTAFDGVEAPPVDAVPEPWPASPSPYVH